MGPVAVLQTTGAKLAAGVYVLFAGTVFLVVAVGVAVGVGVDFAPVVHRAMHRYHLTDDQTRVDLDE